MLGILALYDQAGGKGGDDPGFVFVFVFIFLQ
jgi:hypothetical protein